jgi:hypothetical protein
MIKLLLIYVDIVNARLGVNNLEFSTKWRASGHASIIKSVSSGYWVIGKPTAILSYTVVYNPPQYTH